MSDPIKAFLAKYPPPYKYDSDVKETFAHIGIWPIREQEIIAVLNSLLALVQEVEKIKAERDARFTVDEVQAWREMCRRVMHYTSIDDYVNGLAPFVAKLRAEKGAQG